MRNLFYFLVLALSLVDGAIMQLQQQLRGGADRGPDADAGHRHLQTPDPLFPESYYSTQDPAVLGAPDTNATLGNPLKGLFGGTRWNPPPLLETVPFSLEWYNVALDEVMFGDDEFDWTILDDLIAGTASRKKHSVISFYIDWPGNSLHLPDYLMEMVQLVLYDNDTRLSPYYGDPILLNALQQFITALGNRYDGDTRIYQLHMGLLGFWGEFHTYPFDHLLLPDSTRSAVISWYKAAFNTTQISARYPMIDETVGLGFNDGSFGMNTLDGVYNGGQEVGWYFWPKVVSAGQTDFWRTSAMGGETRPELQAIIFEDGYPGGTYEHQRFIDCVNVTHASAILQQGAFINGGYNGTELLNARAMSAYMGYNFYISGVGVEEGAAGDVSISVQVTQSGVAPFYYDLGLALHCFDLPDAMLLPGVEALVDQGESSIFTFTGIPATAECLGAVSFSLESTHTYNGTSIKFAQGDGTVSLSLPLPPMSAPNTVEDDTPSPITLITMMPTTKTLVTDAPVTAAPVTDAPNTLAAITDAPVALAPVTIAPTTLAPITKAPVTTAAPTLAPLEIFASDFFSSADGFAYKDDLFYSTNNQSAIQGALEVELGRNTNSVITGISGGFQKSFVLPKPGFLTIVATFELMQNKHYGSDEWSQALCSIDGNLVGNGANEFMAQIVGNSNGQIDQSTGFQTVILHAGQLSAGEHLIAIGAYNNKQSHEEARTYLWVDRIAIWVSGMV